MDRGAHVSSELSHLTPDEIQESPDASDARGDDARILRNDYIAELTACGKSAPLGGARKTIIGDT